MIIQFHNDEERATALEVLTILDRAPNFLFDPHNLHFFDCLLRATRGSDISGPTTD